MDVGFFVNEELLIPCRIVKIRVDCACLFCPYPIWSVAGTGSWGGVLSYLVYGDNSRTVKIRADIVSHVSNNLQCFTQQKSGVPYGIKCQYFSEM
ncbi:hypothetical protein AVEN_118607-1 [Araneus ventricosus]|uniref:Uncharacterized protein n=1 Tax=Araneus ventricosus TaxID=182803 RepID=A0A4Y2AWV0_ARAVE|nr:hypothetical protein AVEN_118607-1 [Araneus ventricosus]